MTGETTKKNPWPLRIVLLAILLMLVIAFAWDWWVCRRYEAAWERVSELHQEMIAKPGDAAYGPEDVRKAVGWRSQSGEPVAKEHYYEEVYQLTRGLPWQRYYVCIIYQDVDGEPVYYAPFQGRMPESREVPTKRLQYEDLLESAGFELEEPEGTEPEPEDAGGEPELPDGEDGEAKLPVGVDGAVEPVDEGADPVESPTEESADDQPAGDGGEKADAS